jgi:hypothetical protein
MNKVTKKIMNIGLVLLLCLSSSSVLFSQTVYNLSGTFEGIHIEFANDGSNDSLIYFYKFELEQDEQKVTGKSYIYNDDGYYAVVQVRGLILENQLYFEEFATIDEINPKENSWCYTSGHLDITIEGERASLIGFTKSYTKQYGALCRIGYSKISKIDPDYAEELVDEIQDIQLTNLIIRPNPTEAETNLGFYLKSEQMTIIEVYDLQGELILEVLRRDLLPGPYTIPIDLSFKQDGMYLVELIVNRKLYTTELWKTSF